MDAELHPRAEAVSRKKVVAVVSTGGTIASRATHAGGDVVVLDNASHFQSVLREHTPELDLEFHDQSGTSSFMLSISDLMRLKDAVEALLAQPHITGVVITHGTDTMEETAFFLDLVIDSPKPIVLTGAQRAADDPYPDGPRNVICAVRVAGSPEMAGLGTVIAFEDEIHAARDVTKVHTSRVGTFSSAEHGKLGEVDGEDVLVSRHVPRRPVLSHSTFTARVELVKMTLGASSLLLDACIDAKVDGIVLEAFGRGNVNTDVLKAVERARAAGIEVLVTSRCPQGRVLPVYGRTGGRALERAGAIFAGDMSGPKARLLMCGLLSKTADQTSEGVAEMCRPYLA